MAKPSDLQPGSVLPAPPAAPRPEVADLLGLGSHSARKSYYPELAARLDELERERNRYKWLFEHAVHGIFQASLHDGIRAANPALAHMLGYDDPQEVLWSQVDEVNRQRVLLPGSAFQDHYLACMDVVGNYEKAPRAEGAWESLVEECAGWRGDALVSHELFAGCVAEHIARFHPRDEAVVEVEVRAADRSRRHAHDRVVRIDDRRIGNVGELNVLLALPDDRFHLRPPSR